MSSSPANGDPRSPPDAAPRSGVFFGGALTNRQKATARWLFAALALASLTVVVAGSSTAAESSDAPAVTAPRRDDPSAPVTVRPAQPVETLQRRRRYTGTLKPSRKSTLSFEVAGKLIALAVDEGDTVTESQPLAALDTRRLKAQRAVAEAELANAQAVLKRLVAGPRPQTIAAARADVDSLAAQRDAAQRRRKRSEELAPSEAISQEELDDAVYAHRAAAARTESARAVLEELEAGTREEEVDAQRAQVQALVARLADLDHQLDDAVLTAPFAGRVARRWLDEGTVVAVGEPVFDLIEDAALEAWVGIPPGPAEKLEPGASVSIAVNGAERYAVVQSLRPELDPETRTQNVVFRIADAAGLVAGQVVQVAVDESVDVAGYWAPTAALQPGRRGLWSLLVVDDEGLVAKRPVEVVENDGDRSFVRGALQSGERVIVEGAHRVVVGQEVQAVPADKP